MNERTTLNVEFTKLEEVLRDANNRVVTCRAMILNILSPMAVVPGSGACGQGKDWKSGPVDAPKEDMSWPVSIANARTLMLSKVTNPVTGQQSSMFGFLRDRDMTPLIKEVFGDMIAAHIESTGHISKAQFQTLWEYCVSKLLKCGTSGFFERPVCPGR